jgi:hypothetical protein
MKPAMFREMTHVLGAPSDWDAEKKGECLGLPVAFNREAGTITSCWVPEPEDVAALAAGGRVYLTIVGSAHPPVAMTAKVEA